MNLSKTNMTGILNYVCAVILSIYVSNSYGHGWQDRSTQIDLQAGEQRYIQSPNYPSSYPNYADVGWLVTVPKAYQVMLHFIDFRTYYYDTLFVYDGWTSNFFSLTQRASLYGSTIPLPADIISQGSYLSVRFVSNFASTTKGFQARLSAKLRTIILNTEGAKVLDSPNYPKAYDDNIDAIWQVVAPAGYRIRIRFTYFSTEENTDVVAVHEGWTLENSRSTWRASLSGWSNLANLISQGSYLWVRFTSDNRNRYRGFQALLSAELRAIILNTEETEVLTSPNYPEPYENNIDTIWYVRAPAGHRVLLRFSNFTTGENNDTVTVRDGWTSDYSRSTRKASLFGPSIPDNITSIGSHLWIQFTTDGMYGYTGYRALLHAVIPVIILQTNETQILTSPTFPSGYDNNIDVVWHVRAPSGYCIMVHFSEFYTESDKDLVYLYDGKTSDYRSAGLRETLSGRPVPRNFTTVGAYLWLRFTSDDVNNSYSTGFKAMLTNVETTVIILQTNETQSLTSPNFPSGYDNNIDVVWHVRAPSGYRIVVHFSEFYTESDKDLVYLYDGKTSEYRSAGLRETLSGRPVPRNITTVGAYLWLRFTSDDVNASYYTGFKAMLTTVETTVIILQTNETKQLTSPNFPTRYDSNIDIVWHAMAPSGYRIMVHFIEFNTESGRDFVYVYDGKTSEYQSSDPRDTISGRSAPRDVTTVGAYLWIRFTSDNSYFSSYSYTGFKAVLTTVETTVIMLDTIETEYVSIPSVPGYYDNNIDIALQVIATTGFRVHVLFRRFETEENSDFVYIYEGWTSDFSRSTLRASLSGFSIPENITSIGSYIWIRFASNEVGRFRGFQTLLNAKIPASPTTTPQKTSTTSPTTSLITTPTTSPTTPSTASPRTTSTASPTTPPTTSPTNQPTTSTTTSTASPRTPPTASPTTTPPTLPTTQPTTSRTTSITTTSTTSPKSQPTTSPTTPPTASPRTTSTASPTIPPTTSPTTTPTASTRTTSAASPTTTSTTSPTNQPMTSTTNTSTASPRTPPTASPTTTPPTLPTTPPTASPRTTSTASPTIPPTTSPTTTPTASTRTTSTASPTTTSTTSPTNQPTTSTTNTSTASPTTPPTASPTTSPTTIPTTQPTTSPTTPPTASPITQPTTYPTTPPTASPTTQPTTSPTTQPTTYPTTPPTTSPTTQPTTQPSTPPTTSPTNQPTTYPTTTPTASPRTPTRASPTTLSKTSPTNPITTPLSTSAEASTVTPVGTE